jgi:hypothetical protein
MTFQLASTQLSTVTAYNQAQIRTAESAIIANYNDLFNQISSASSTGLTSLTYSLSNAIGDQTPLVNLLTKYGYTSSISNNILTVDWSKPTSVSLTANPITGFNINTINGTVSTLLSVDIKPLGGLPPYTFSYTGNLPDSCTFSSTNAMAVITGTPLVASEQYSTLTVSVVDSSFPIAQTFSQDINWTIAALNNITNATPTAPTYPITGTNITSFSGSTSVPLSVNIKPTGGVAPYTISLTGTLPTGLTSSSNTASLVISGTPQIAGASLAGLTVNIRDSVNNTFKQDVSYTITGSTYSPNAITGFNRNSFTGITGTLLNAVFKPIGGVAPYSFSFTGTLPHNCVYTATNSFTISGAPDTPVVRIAGLTLSVIDSVGNTFSQDIDYTITQGPTVNLTSGLGTSYISALSMMMP